MARRPEHEVRRDHWKFAGIGVACLVLGGVLDVDAGLLGPVGGSGLATLDLSQPFHAAVTALFAVGGVLIVGPVWHRRWYFSEAQRFRRELGVSEGWLDRHDYDTVAGAAGLRGKGEETEPHTRPGPGQRPPAITRYGFSPGVLVSGPRNVRGRAVYALWSRGVCLLGPQGSGKSQLIIHMILDAPGFTLVNSTKPELVVMTERLRALLGPTALFNPLGLGGLINTFGWDPVADCADEATAERRAQALVRGAGGAAGIHNKDFWAGQAAAVLRCYLMAAALGELDMTAVMYWANNPDDDTTPISILEQHADTPAGWASQLRSLLGTVPETRDGYMAQVRQATAFMDSATVRAACRPGRGRRMDLRGWVQAGGTLYVIGSDEDKRLAPLFTALTEEVFFVAKQVAAEQGGRLRTPATLLLDEVAHMSPVALHTWAGDSRGAGITVAPVVQSRSQFAATWGRDNADTIWRNLPVRLALPGINDRETLEELSYLSGERPVRERTEGTNHHGGGGFGSSVSERLSTEPVIRGPAIGAMPPWQCTRSGWPATPRCCATSPATSASSARPPNWTAARPKAGPADRTRA